MTICAHHIPDLDRFKPYYKSPMLMLGATGSACPGYPTARDYFGQWVGDGYQTLDLDGGDLRLDLNKDLGLNGLSVAFETVFNLGTIEHVWDANAAWVNALRMVKIGGHFLTHSPVSGYKDHGLHLTSAPAIRAFVSKNGFTILDHWITKRPVGDVLWLAAVKDRHIENLADFEPAWQVYEAGQKKAVR
jgi:hypothetical protein